jgi:hypothetical protein
MQAVVERLLTILVLIGCLGCGGSDDTFEEGLSLSAEVQEVSAATEAIRVGEITDVDIEVETGDLFGAQDLILFVRYSPQLELVGTPYVSISASSQTNDGGFTEFGVPFFGQIPLFCQGSSVARGDIYLAVYIDGRYFTEAFNDTATVTLQFRGLQTTQSAFVTASAAEDPDSADKCDSYSADAEGAVEISIAP